jgi:hypothetical protein
MNDAAGGAGAQCRNCGTPLGGRFCAHCGQAADVHVPSTRELIHEAFEGITHSDSRLWSTLLLLWFKPGKLTQEFVAGRRVAYLPPFRLYLVMSVLFFLLASLRPPSSGIVKFDDVPQKGDEISQCENVHATVFGRDWGPRISHACSAIARDEGAGLLHLGIGTMSKAMFVFLPLVAFLHMLLYWWPRHRYAEDLLFFLHLHAFFFSVMTLVVLAAYADDAWPRWDGLWRLFPLLLWSLPVYTVLAMKRVFGRRWTATLVKASALFVVYLVVLIITLVGVVVYAMLQL